MFKTVRNCQDSKSSFTMCAMMRSMLGCLALALFAACSSGTGAVDGLVYETQREIAMQGALVSIRSLEGGGEEQYALTDLNGIYRFEKVPEGLNRVSVVKEGYNSTSSVKIADVVEDEILRLDFPLRIIPLLLYQEMTLTLVDDQGPIKGATVDFYRGPCIGKVSPCVVDLPIPEKRIYNFRGFFRTDANGQAKFTVAGGSEPLEEFNEYIFQFRITAPRHQNLVQDIRVTISTLPKTLQFAMQRTS